MGVNQVLVGDEVKLDLTADTVSEDNLLAGATAHNAAGEPITGAFVTVPVDSELSETSENAIQNMAVAKAVKGGNSLSGSTGYKVNNSVEYPLVGLKVFGKSTQDGTPTSENPVEIVSVVEPTVTMCGKNITNGEFNISSASGEYTDVCRLSKGTYSIKLFDISLKSQENNYSLTLRTIDDNGNRNTILEKNRFSPSDNISITFKIDVDCYLKWHWWWDEYNTVSFKQMLVCGDEIPTSYEPYTAKALTLSDTLNAIPVSSGGNVTIDGQEYMADYKDYGTGKYHRLVDPNKLDPAVSIVDNLGLLLETEEVTDIPETELQAYRQLQTYNGVTNISNDKGAGLSVEYCTNKALSDCVMPVTKDLQKQIDDLKAAVLSLGGNV